MVLLYSDAVLHAAGQEDEVRRVQSFILFEDVILNIFQLYSEPVNQFLSLPISEVLLCVLAQRNLDRSKQEAAEERQTNPIIEFKLFFIIVLLKQQKRVIPS